MRTKRSKWPCITAVTHPSGNVTYQIDLGIVDGNRKRVNRSTKEAAETFAEQCRIAKANEGMAAFALPMDARLDAAKSNQILAPHNVTILEATKYYQKHVLAFKNAPTVKEVVQRYIVDCSNRNLRPRTIGDLEHRLNNFAADFGNCRLSEITLNELTEWIQDAGWEMRTRINYLTKLSQLYSYAIKRKWADSNLTELIDRPTVDDTKAEIFTVEQAERLLTHSHEFDLLPYIAIGLFAGVRSAELTRLDAKEINFEEKIITIGADVAKKRSQRKIDMQDALLAWLEPCKEQLQKGGPITDQNKFRKNKGLFLEIAGFDEWTANGLRHSFGSYHLAMFRNSDDTAHQMGNSSDIVHKYYKALVSKTEAEKFWNLRPPSGIKPNITKEKPKTIISVE